MATDLVVTNSEQVSGSQAGAVCGENPRRKQDAVWAGERAARHLSCCGNPLADGRVVQRNRARLGGLDPSQGTQYTLVHVTLISCEVHQRPQHASVVGYGGGSEMFKSRVQVVIDAVRGQVAGLPWQAATEDDELLQVAGASANAAPVGAGKFYDGHGAHSQRVGDYPVPRPTSTPPQIRYNPPMGQLAQLYSRWVVWLSLRRWTILRGLHLTLLCVCLYLHRVESALGLLALGQLADAIREFRRR